MDPQDRHQFLNFSGMVLGGLALVAIGLGWAVEIDPLSKFSWSWRACGCGLVGTLPLFVLFAGVYRLPIGAFRTIRKFLTTELAPSLAVLTWFDLIFLAMLTGIAEELFFRGLLEPWMTSSRFPWTGRVASSLLFGMAHVVTPTYGLMTFVAGYYLSWLMTWVDPPNLLVPIVAHAVYDYGGFLIIIWLHRRDAAQSPNLRIQ